MTLFPNALLALAHLAVFTIAVPLPQAGSSSSKFKWAVVFVAPSSNSTFVLIDTTARHSRQAATLPA